MKILIVEDDPLIGNSLGKILSHKHYLVDIARDGAEGWQLAQAFSYDLMLLDVKMPKLDGITLCKRLRQAGCQIPILLMTAQNSSTDKVMGLDAGADDYVIKPFEIEELLARIRVLLRRSNEFLPPILVWENLRLNPNSCEVTYADQPLHLTPKEYGLLELFLRNNHRVFSRSAILEHLWSFEDPPNEETVTSHIKGLRQKLKLAGAAADFIETVYGLGYRLKDSKMAGASEGKSKAVVNGNKKSKVRQETATALSEVWQQFKGQVNQRIEAILNAGMAFLNSTATEELQQNTKQEAHKLAGSLGVFGFVEASRIAKEMEEILKAEGCLNHSEAQRFCELVSALKRELESTPTDATLPTNKGNGEAVVLMVDADKELTQAIKLEAQKWGVRLQIASTLTQARDFLQRQIPDGVILDLCLSENDGGSFSLLGELTQQVPPVPVLVLTVKDSFTDRLEVARLGGRAFVHKPIPPAQVLETITQMLKPALSSKWKVLAVDDDPQLLAALKALLEPWGLRLVGLNEPLRFWDVLAEQLPDLLVLDVEMPGLSGIDLCQVVRNDLRWGDMPVLFLTAHTDADTVQRVFMAGADDYISKPIVGPELVTRVISRLERVRHSHFSG